MGRSVLTRCDDQGFIFTYLNDLSSHKFVNVSVQRQQIDQATADRIGLLEAGEMLWIWGSGRYRSSDVYLPVTTLESAINGKPRLRFFAGSRTELAWSDVEDDAARYSVTARSGGSSVRWNSFTQQWFATFNSQNPKAILLHHAPFPWGPWSQRSLRLFDSGDGIGDFIHKLGATDGLQDDMFEPGSVRLDQGDAYGPYKSLITPGPVRAAEHGSISRCQRGTPTRSC